MICRLVYASVHPSIHGIFLGCIHSPGRQQQFRIYHKQPPRPSYYITIVYWVLKSARIHSSIVYRHYFKFGCVLLTLLHYTSASDYRTYISTINKFVYIYRVYYAYYYLLYYTKRQCNCDVKSARIYLQTCVSCSSKLVGCSLFHITPQLLVTIEHITSTADRHFYKFLNTISLFPLIYIHQMYW